MGGRSSKTANENTEIVKNGEPMKYDPTFKGPIKNRGCTDIICCIIFAIFILAFLIVGIYAFAMGDPSVLLYPTDSDGKLCGVGQNKGKPYLFYFNLLKCGSDLTGIIKDQNIQICPTHQICIDKCPTDLWSPISYNGDTQEVDVVKHAICNGTYPTDRPSLLDAISKEVCAPFYVPSAPIVYRCLPDASKFSLLPDNSVGYNQTQFLIDHNTPLNGTKLKEGVSSVMSIINLQSYGVKILADVTASWWLILIFVGIAMVLAFIWIVLMRWLAGIIVWVTILAFVGFFAFATYYSFNKYVQLKNAGKSESFTFTTNFDYYANLKETWLALGIISVVILAIILLLLLFLIKRLLIAIALIKEASRAISYMMFTLVWPIFPFILQIIALSYWGASAICLAAISKTSSCEFSTAHYNDTIGSKYTDVRCSVQNVFKQLPISCSNNASSADGQRLCNDLKGNFEGDYRYTLVLQAFQLFMWFWVMNFIIALGQVTLAGAFASYYWAFNKSTDVPTFPVMSSLGRALRYHTGSMAFGALLIAIVQIIIVILEYLDHKLKGSPNIVARFVLKCCICCFWCLEKFLKFLNKNAYIMIAVHGKNFCRSAFDAFSLILRNVVRVFVVDKVTDLLLFISKLMVVGAVGVFAYFLFAREIPGVEKVLPVAQINLNYYLIPVLIIICGSYIVASLFFGVYDMAVDTLFLCFLEDLERNDGSTEKPYYMNKELMNILGKKNKPPVAADNGKQNTAFIMDPL